MEYTGCRLTFCDNIKNKITFTSICLILPQNTWLLTMLIVVVWLSHNIGISSRKSCFHSIFNADSSLLSHNIGISSRKPSFHNIFNHFISHVAWAAFNHYFTCCMSHSWIYNLCCRPWHKTLFLASPSVCLVYQIWDMYRYGKWTFKFFVGKIIQKIFSCNNSHSFSFFLNQPVDNLPPVFLPQLTIPAISSLQIFISITLHQQSSSNFLTSTSNHQQSLTSHMKVKFLFETSGFPNFHFSPTKISYTRCTLSDKITSGIGGISNCGLDVAFFAVFSPCVISWWDFILEVRKMESEFPLSLFVSL